MDGWAESQCQVKMIVTHSFGLGRVQTIVVQRILLKQLGAACLFTQGTVSNVPLPMLCTDYLGTGRWGQRLRRWWVIWAEGDGSYFRYEETTATDVSGELAKCL